MGSNGLIGSVQCYITSLGGQSYKSTTQREKRMKQFELSYRKPLDESFQPSCRTNRKASGSVSEDTVQRIVRLYSGGQSIESITKEVSRARHVVVHVLQSKGVFGNRPAEPDHKETRTVVPAVEESKEEPLRHAGAR
jgi:hypothetical protein